MATWSDMGDGSRKKRAHIDAYRGFWLHFGSQMGAKLEPKVVKTAIKNALKFVVDFKIHCDRFAQTAAASRAVRESVVRI